MNKLRFNILLIVGLLFAQSCVSQSKKEIEIDENNIAEILLSTIYNKEGLGNNTYEKPQYFHCKLSVLNDDNLIANVAFNQHKPLNNYCSSIDINGIKTFIYYDNCDSKTIKNQGSMDAFYFPDSKMWDFLIWNINDEYIYMKLTPYYKEGTEDIKTMDSIKF